MDWIPRTKFSSPRHPVRLLYLENLELIFTIACSHRRTSESDGVVAVNQTNLALKGIIGIGAMAKISAVVGKTDDASRYQVRTLHVIIYGWIQCIILRALRIDMPSNGRVCHCRKIKPVLSPNTDKTIPTRSCTIYLRTNCCDSTSFQIPWVVEYLSKCIYHVTSQ